MQYLMIFAGVAFVITVYAIRVLLLTSAESFPDREDKALWFVFLLTFNVIAAAIFLVQRPRLIAAGKAARRQRRRDKSSDALAQVFADDGKSPP
jgi:hypothetical protein